MANKNHLDSSHFNSQTTRYQLFDGYFHVVYNGEYSLNGMASLGTELIEYSLTKQQQFALVDISNAEGNLSIMDRYYLADLMAEKWPKSLVISLVLNTSQTIKVLGFFWQKLARHNGFMVNIDFDQTTALDWLLAQANQNQKSLVG
ncbi:hypothetical protein ACUR5C_12180 [Aliikangiella sp. IMCC44653]